MNKQDEHNLNLLMLKPYREMNKRDEQELTRLMAIKEKDELPDWIDSISAFFTITFIVGGSIFIVKTVEETGRYDIHNGLVVLVATILVIPLSKMLGINWFRDKDLEMKEQEEAKAKWSVMVKVYEEAKKGSK